MRHRYAHVYTLAALALAALVLPSRSEAQLYAVDNSDYIIYSYQDTVATVANPDSSAPYVEDMALDHEGRILLATRYCNTDVVRFDVDAQTFEFLDPYVTGSIAVAVAPSLGDDIYVAKENNWKDGGPGRGRQGSDFLGVLWHGVGPADSVYAFAGSPKDIAVRPSGPRAGNIIALVEDDGLQLIEIERTETDSFLYYDLIVDAGMMPMNATSIAFDDQGQIIILDYEYGLNHVDEEYGYVWGFGAIYGPGLTDVEVGADGTIYVANTVIDRIIRCDSDGYPFGSPFSDDLCELGAVGIQGYTPTPEGEDVLVEPGENIEVTYEEVTSSGFTTATVTSTTSRVSPEGNRLPDCAQLPGTRADDFDYILLATDAVYSGLIQVDVLDEGSRLFFASGTGDTFRDFTVVGSIDDARGTIPRFSELPAGGMGRVETGPTEVVLVEDDRALSEVTTYKFWRLELAMEVPDNMPGGDPCPWEFIEWLQKYVESARGYYDTGDYANALSELAIMNSMIRSHAGWCIPESSDDPLGDMVGQILAHSKTLMFSIELESGEPFTGVDDDGASMSLAVANPASGEARLHLTGPVGADVAVRIYSVSGRLVATVYEGRLPDGGETVVWNGRDSGGAPVGSGVYFARVESDREVLTSKVVYLR